MAKTTIPAFLVPKFNECRTKGEKDEFILRYRSWKQMEFTEDLLQHVEGLLEQSTVEGDKEFSFLTVFQSKYHSAYKKSERNTLRRLIKLIKG